MSSPNFGFSLTFPNVQDALINLAHFFSRDESIMMVRVTIYSLLLLLFGYADGSLFRGSLNETLYNDEPQRSLAESFRPGDFSSKRRSNDGMIDLSNGLSCIRIAKTGEKVKLAGGKKSKVQFHDQPDGAAVFRKRSGGGWYYVSNAEVDKLGSSWDKGGVGRIEFNKHGKVIGYERIANNMGKNWYDSLSDNNHRPQNSPPFLPILNNKWRRKNSLG
jgi:hypothetical protein